MRSSSIQNFNLTPGKVIMLLALLLGVLPVTSRADVRDGLLSYWPLEVINTDTTPNTTPDLAFSNALSVVGPPTISGGQFGNAFTFNGSSTTYLTNLHSPDNSISGLPIYRAGSYTITMWVKGGAQTAKYLYAEASTASNNPLLILQTGQTAANNAKFDVIIRTDGGVVLVNHVASATIVFDNNWHHIGWVDDRGAVKLYIDGNLDSANFNYAPSGTFTMNTTAIGTLIRAAISTAAIFNGQIDDVAVWERPLTQPEVQQVMTSSLQTPIPTLPSIVQQPLGGSRGPGDRMVFNARAAGNRPFSYQWYKDGTAISGATSNLLVQSNLTAADAGDYKVVVSNLSGSVTSLVATLTFVPDPAANIPQGLISYWPLDDVTGNDLGQSITPDLYSHNEMLLVNMDLLNQVTGAFGEALNFNGTDEYGLRTAGFPIYNNPGYSVSFWVNGTAQADHRFFAESSTNNNNSLFTFGTHTNGVDGTVRVYIRNDSGTVLLDRNSVRVALDNTWRHVVWTETNGQGKLYIDGVLDDNDYTYTRGTLTVNQTAIGAIVRAAVGSYFSGNLDEVAVWNRVLTYTEIQQIHTAGIPRPVMAIPPTITQQPTNQMLLTGGRATFTFTATGTSPLFPQWRKNGSDLPNQTNFSLVLNNLQLSDAGDYLVLVTNSAGRATSEVATLTVNVRPPSPTQLFIDFNNTGADDVPTNTESGFSSFSLPTFGPGPFTRTYGGADITIAGAGVNLESRKRATPTNGPSFTQEKLLQDFIFARDTTPDTGLDLNIDFLEPNKSYAVTIWSFDSGSTTARISDWTANGTEVRTAWTFDGATLPTTDDQYQFSFNLNADPSGSIAIQGRRTSGATAVFNVFINAIKVVRREMRIVSITINDFNEIHLVIEVLNPSATHRIEETQNLGSPHWTEVQGVLFSGPNGYTLEATFSPDTSPGFYRVVETP